MVFSNNKATLSKIILGICSLPIILLSASTATHTIDAFPKLKIESWPHKHVFVQAGSGTKVLGRHGGSSIGSHYDNSNQQPLPLGVPFDIDTPLFRGKMLIRFRSVKSDDEKAHNNYFKSNKRLMQTVLQGQFKKRMKMSDVYAGSIFPQPLAGAPPPTLSKVMDTVIRKVAPGLVFDLASDSPKVIALMAGTSQTMAINNRGEEPPDITLPIIEENVVHKLGKSVGTSAAKRKKTLSNPKHAANYEFNTHDVYTFHTYDEALDYGRGTMHIPVYGDMDIKPHIGKQAWSLTGIAKGGEKLYDLKIWHAGGK